MPIAVCKLFALPSLWAAAPPWRSAAPPPDSRIIPPAHRMRSQSASLAGARSAFTARPASGGGEQDGRREPWRMQRRTPEGSAPPLKGSPLPRSAHQRRRSKGGEPGSDPWRGADHGGACGSGADRGLSGSCGSEDPEGLRPALLLELQRPLLDRGDRHQAARGHGMGTDIKEPDSCPGRIKAGRLVLDADRADGGGGGDGRIGRGLPNQAPIRGNPRQALQQGNTTTEQPGGHRNSTHRGEPQRGTNTAKASAPAAAKAARSSSTWASCSSWASLSC